jgi:hypothetical protein
MGVSTLLPASSLLIRLEEWTRGEGTDVASVELNVSGPEHAAVRYARIELLEPARRGDEAIEKWRLDVPMARSFAAGPYDVARHLRRCRWTRGRVGDVLRAMAGPHGRAGARAAVDPFADGSRRTRRGYNPSDPNGRALSPLRDARVGPLRLVPIEVDPLGGGRDLAGRGAGFLSALEDQGKVRPGGSRRIWLRATGRTC